MTGLAVARAPLGFHAANAPTRDRHAECRLPLADQIRDGPAQLLPVPVVEELAAPVGRRGGRDLQQQPVAVDLQVRPTRTLAEFLEL